MGSGTRIALPARSALKAVPAIARALAVRAGSSPSALAAPAERDLAIEVPDSPLEAVMSHEVWEDYYNRLASRIVAGLSVQTSAGPLYDVDTRLRPQGEQGMLAVSLDAFAAYQRTEAWTWEHLALCRARPLADT